MSALDDFDPDEQQLRDMEMRHEEDFNTTPPQPIKDTERTGRDQWSHELYNFMYDASQVHGDTRLDSAVWLDRASVLINQQVFNALETAKSRKGVVATGVDGKTRTTFSDVVPVSVLTELQERYK